MVLDSELLPDQRGNPRSGPELGGEAEFAGHPLEPGEHLSLLVAVELGGSPRMGNRIESIVATLPSGGDPTTNTSITDAEDTGHFGDGRSFLDSPDGTLASPFEFLSTSVWSHAENQNRLAD
jgi:hypothetical protein